MLITQIIKICSIFLLSLDGSLNAPHAGLTPLMRAAIRNRADIVENLLKKGANPHVQNAKDETASDLALLTGNEELIEFLISAEKEDDYREVLANLFWIDTLEEIEKKSSICKNTQDNFRSCLLKTNRYLDEKNMIIVTHFDLLQDNKLVNIQIDAPLSESPKKVIDDFNRIYKKIAQSIPRSHQAFVEKKIDRNINFFEGLQKQPKRNEFYAYWSDEDKTKPLFIHLKIRNEGLNKGGVRVRLGNPFRTN